MTGVAQTGGVSLVAVGVLGGKAVLFLVVAVVVGVRLAPTLVRWVGKLRARGTLIVYSVVFAVALAAVADVVGLATMARTSPAVLLVNVQADAEHHQDHAHCRQFDRQGACRPRTGCIRSDDNGRAGRLQSRAPPLRRVEQQRRPWPSTR